VNYLTLDSNYLECLESTNWSQGSFDIACGTTRAKQHYIYGLTRSRFLRHWDFPIYGMASAHRQFLTQINQSYFQKLQWPSLLILLTVREVCYSGMVCCSVFMRVN